MSASSPLGDPRDRTAIEEAIRDRIGGYTPGWRPGAGSASTALLEVFAGQVAVFEAGLSQVPHRNRLAFLGELGTGLLRARSARAPLVFRLMEDAMADANVPVNTQVAAPAVPPPASPLPELEAEPAPEEAVFATIQTIAAARAKLAAVYSLDPPNDRVADHADCLTTGFTLFEAMEPVEHALYLGHGQDFAIAGAAVIRLSLRLAAYPPETVRQGLSVSWSYLAESGWIPLDVVEDGTEGLTTSGEIRLESTCGPEAIEETIGEHKSFWIRGLLDAPLPPDGAGGSGRLPAIDLVEQRVELSRGDLQPDAAIHDSAPLDISNRFLPFGPRPALHMTFYLACGEAFSRSNADILLHVVLVSDLSTEGDPQLGWQYFDGEEWADLEEHGIEDGTENLTKSGDIAFRCPEDWTPTEVQGTEGYWLRARIDSGNYGEPMRLEVDTSTSPETVTLEKEDYDPPVLEQLRISFTYVTEADLADHCLSSNNEVLVDHSEDARWQRRPFEPFVPLDDLQPAVYLGFDQPLPPGLVSLYLHRISDSAAPSGAASPFVWEYQTGNGWTELSVRDDTAGFRIAGMIQLVGPGDAVASEGRGGELYRGRARLKRGESPQLLPVDGLWLNAVWATHREHLEQDIRGASDGNPGQSFGLLRATGSVLEGELVEVREWVGTGADWETAAEDVPEADRRLETDSGTGAVTALWVRWHRVDHLFESGPEDRHYSLEPARNLIRFGDGVHGRIPSARSRVSASYDSGGGVAANVSADSITELRGAVASLESVGNPIPAEGGADIEPEGRVHDRGPQRLRHRDRAVTAEDFEWLARETSAAVYHARCLPLTGEAGFAQRGWVTLLIAPESPDPQPRPTAELLRQVLKQVTDRCPAAVASQVLVKGPEYVPVGVVCEIVPERAGDAAVVEARVRASLDAFLHPVSGGPGGRGWRFGEAVYLSQVARVVELETEGVDHAVKLRMRVGGTLYGDMVPVGEDLLAASGEHEIKIRLGAG